MPRLLVVIVQVTVLTEVEALQEKVEPELKHKGAGAVPLAAAIPVLTASKAGTARAASEESATRRRIAQSFLVTDYSLTLTLAPHRIIT